MVVQAQERLSGSRNILNYTSHHQNTLFKKQIKDLILVQLIMIEMFL